MRLATVDFGPLCTSKCGNKITTSEVTSCVKAEQRRWGSEERAAEDFAGSVPGRRVRSRRIMRDNILMSDMQGHQRDSCRSPLQFTSNEP
jgi:hypothetical protein